MKWLIYNAEMNLYFGGFQRREGGVIWVARRDAKTFGSSRREQQLMAERVALAMKNEGHSNIYAVPSER